MTEDQRNIGFVMKNVPIYQGLYAFEKEIQRNKMLSNLTVKLHPDAQGFS